MAELKLYTLSEIEDEIVGSIGTPERDQYEAKLAEELHAIQICNKRTRLQ